MEAIRFASAFPVTEPAAEPAAPSDSNTEKHSKKKYPTNYFLVLCDDFRKADIELDDEVFSGFQMVVLLLDEIEDYMHNRRGTIKGVTKLLARRGIEFSERTVKDYITKARKLKKEDKDNTVAKLREHIFAAARKAGRSIGGSPASPCSIPDALPEDALPEPRKEEAPLWEESASTPAEGSVQDQQDACPQAVCEADDFALPGGGWLDAAICQAMDSQADGQSEQPVQQKQAAGRTSAMKKQAGKKHGKRRPRRSR